MRETAPSVSIVKYESVCSQHRGGNVLVNWPTSRWILVTVLLPIMSLFVFSRWYLKQFWTVLRSMSLSNDHRSFAASAGFVSTHLSAAEASTWMLLLHWTKTGENHQVWRKQNKTNKQTNKKYPPPPQKKLKST